MIAIACLLTLIGLTDLLYHLPPSAHAPWWRPTLLSLVAFGSTALTFVAMPGWGAAGVIMGSGLWFLTYFERRALAMIGAGLTMGALIAPVALSTTGTGVNLFLPSGRTWQYIMWSLIILGLGLVNLATANRVVRTVLAFTAHSPAPNIGAPRAGRVIGVLERLLLIALAISGQAISIAGLAAAKSIIRYPEISAASRAEGGLSAEVFFIGTVTSWLIALGSAGLILLALG